MGKMSRAVKKFFEISERKKITYSGVSLAEYYVQNKAERKKDKR